MIYEVEHGVLSTQIARPKREQGGFTPLALYVDAKSVYAAITACMVKVPTDKYLITHVQYIRGK